MGIFSKKDRREAADEQPTAITLDDLLSLIGWDLGDGNLQSVFERYRLVALPSEDKYGLDDRRTFTNPHVGVEVACDELMTLTTLFLHSDGHQGFAGYRGSLIDDVTFNDTRASMRTRLGPPVAARESTDSDHLGSIGPWDEWVISRRVVHASYYHFVFHVSYRMDDERIEMVTITGSEIATTESSTIQSPGIMLAPAERTESHSDDVESTDSRNRTPNRIEMNSLNGSDIIEAWLDELEAMQPEYGPLLQSTLDLVGNLPAVGADGNIYTVSHNRYWTAVGYSQSYARNRADGRRIDAVLAEAQAKDAGNEPAMVRKETEAEFWATVQGWVNSNEPSRMLPDVLPSWLARFSPGRS